jgi:hypothetical protein
MSKKIRPSKVAEVIDALFSRQDTVTSGDVARQGGVTRQAAHYQLRAMVERGELQPEGAGRGSRYRRKALLRYHYPLAELSESDVWASEKRDLIRRDLDILDNPRIMPLLNFTFTKMVNNAIDHSKGSTLDVHWYLASSHIAFEVVDDGIGAFTSMRVSRHLSSDFDAIGEIAKGKQTTAPDAHSGLGIYFTSRMADRFVLSSGSLSWIVDHRIDDSAIEWLDTPRRGTLVRCEFDADTVRTPIEAFHSMSVPDRPGVQRSTIRVSLFQRGDNFISRTEAKRLAAELDTFDIIEIDFTGVRQIGQGFIDELFRVWQSDHPQSRLIAINGGPVVDALLRLTR